MPSPSFRAYFALVGVFALWVGAWGYVVPAEVVRALPWTVPPLHARFIAAIYLAGLLAMILALIAKTLAEVRIPIALAATWTGMLFLVSMLHLEAFDFAKPQVWFWMGAYAVFPLWGAWLYVLARIVYLPVAAGGTQRLGVIDLPGFYAGEGKGPGPSATRSRGRGCRAASPRSRRACRGRT
jgi:hypothetical protein